MVPAELGGITHLVPRDSIGWVAYPFLALLMATCGMLGGMLARRWQAPGGDTTEG